MYTTVIVVNLHCDPSHSAAQLCCHLDLSLQGFNSSDSEDDHSDDDEEHDDGMSGDEEMGEQEDFEGSFDEVQHNSLLYLCCIGC